jgi:phytoene dehydrogenase-like protein
MTSKVVIIGAGLAGLSSASYLQRNGFDTEILEMSGSAGGLCASWKRGGYTFDGCIHWLMGSSPASSMHAIWKELGAGELEYREWDIHTVFGLANGDSFTVYTDPDRLEKEMLRLGPEDGAVIKRITSGIRAAKRLDLPVALDAMPLGRRVGAIAGLARILPLLGDMRRPAGELVARVKSAKLREGLEAFLGGSDSEFPLGGLYFMLGYMAKGTAGYPMGGSKAFIGAIERKYLALGGSIRYDSRVDEILVEEGKAVGVLCSGERIPADYVVSAADAHDTFARMLKGKYAIPILDSSFRGEGLKPYPSLVYVSFGLGRTFPDLPHSLSMPLSKPIAFAGLDAPVSRITLRTYSFDPSFAPAGKTAATVMLSTTNDEYWSSLAEGDRPGYLAAKKSIAQAVAAAVDEHVPGFASAVEVVDVATPHTFKRYTNNWRGSYEGWLPSGGSLGKGIPRAVPGIAGLHLVGQWENPGGGLPPCAMDGRKLARRLCRQEGRRFRS